jgi:hypothetical protein
LQGQQEKILLVLILEKLRHKMSCRMKVWNIIFSVLVKCVIKDTLTFDSQCCEIMKKGLGRLVKNAFRTSNNVYILNEIKGEK